jgi:hypothetical protein
MSTQTCAARRRLHLAAADQDAHGQTPLELDGRPQAIHDPTGRWTPIHTDEIEYRPIAATPVTRYRWRGTTIPHPWPAAVNA